MLLLSLLGFWGSILLTLTVSLEEQNLEFNMIMSQNMHISLQEISSSERKQIVQFL